MAVGEAKCEGTITMTFVWNDAGTGEPPPSAVIIKETGAAGWQAGNAAGNTGTCSNTLGHATQNQPSGETIGQSASGVKYSVRQSPGQSFQVSSTPTASVNAPTETEAMLGGVCSVSYQVEVSPLRLILDGGLQTPALSRYLIGQRWIANLAPAPLTPASHIWAVTGGSPFANYTASASSALLTYITNVTSPSCVGYFASPATATISCTVAFSVPSGSLPGAGVLATVSQATEVSQPFVADIDSATGYVAGNPPDNPSAIGAYGFGLPQYEESLGAVFSARITTPSEFELYSDHGAWSFVQTIDVGRDRVSGGVNQRRMLLGPNGEHITYGLDNIYPYMGWFGSGELGTCGDRPQEVLIDATSYSINEHFSMYVFYQPPGLLSKPVPIGKWLWWWSGSATGAPGYIWQVTPGVVGCDGFEGATHPQWDRRIVVPSVPWQNLG